MFRFGAIPAGIQSQQLPEIVIEMTLQELSMPACSARISTVSPHAHVSVDCPSRRRTSMETFFSSVLAGLSSPLIQPLCCKPATLRVICSCGAFSARGHQSNSGAAPPCSWDGGERGAHTGKLAGDSDGANAAGTTQLNNSG